MQNSLLTNSELFLLQLVLKNMTHAKQYAKNIVLDPNLPILADMQFDANYEHIYVMNPHAVSNFFIEFTLFLFSVFYWY